MSTFKQANGVNNSNNGNIIATELTANVGNGRLQATGLTELTVLKVGYQQPG